MKKPYNTPEVIGQFKADFFPDEGTYKGELLDPGAVAKLSLDMIAYDASRAQRPGAKFPVIRELKKGSIMGKTIDLTQRLTVLNDNPHETPGKFTYATKLALERFGRNLTPANLELIRTIAGSYDIFYNPKHARTIQSLIDHRSDQKPPKYITSRPIREQDFYKYQK